MRFLYYILPLVLLASCSGSKKSKRTTIEPKLPTSGIVKYDIALDLSEEGKGMAEVFGDKATAVFNESYLRFEKNKNPKGGEYQIVDLATDIETNYLEAFEEKFAITIPAEQLPDIGELTFHEETKQIAGYTCQKATAPMGGEEMVIYYTKAIGVNFCPYIDFNGFALEYELVMPYGKVKYTATETLLQSIDNSFVRPPVGYKAVTPDEFNAEMVKKMQKKEGVTAEGFVKKDINGHLIDLEDLQGKVVVINFWFTACMPCQIEIPLLNELKAEMAGKDVTFLAATFDDVNTIVPFLQTHPFNYTIIPNARDMVLRYEVFVYPTTMVLDKTGKVVDSRMGGSSKIKEEIKAIIEKALLN